MWGTLCDINCLYSETQVMLKLARRARGHFVALIEIRVHLIRVKPGHISRVQAVLTCLFVTKYK